MSRLDFFYDPVVDVLTVEGVRYSGDLFRKFGGVRLTPSGRCVQITEREGGVITAIEQKHREDRP